MIYVRYESGGIGSFQGLNEQEVTLLLDAQGEKYSLISKEQYDKEMDLINSKRK